MSRRKYIPDSSEVKRKKKHDAIKKIVKGNISCLFGENKDHYVRKIVIMVTQRQDKIEELQSQLEELLKENNKLKRKL